MANKKTNILVNPDKLFKTFERQEFVRFRDKVSFILGSFNVAFTCFLLGRLPEWMPFFFTIKAITLISTRYLAYRKKGMHYYLYDFCYFVNFIVLLYLYVFPNRRILFVICFSFANGPLAWAILTWRNSMVYHSIDKMTSIFIHLGPPILFYTMRWYYAAPFYNICGTTGQALIDGKLEDGTTCTIDFFEASVYPFIPYFLWQLTYLIKTEVVSKKKVTNLKYVTSFKTFMEDKKGFVNGLIRDYSYGRALFIFVSLQFGYTALTLIPIKLLFDYQWFHTAFMIGILLISLWNGANFYIEVFAKKYTEELKKLVPLEQEAALSKQPSQQDHSWDKKL